MLVYDSGSAVCEVNGECRRHVKGSVLGKDWIALPQIRSRSRDLPVSVRKDRRCVTAMPDGQCSLIFVMHSHRPLMQTLSSPRSVPVPARTRCFHHYSCWYHCYDRSHDEMEPSQS